MNVKIKTASALIIVHVLACKFSFSLFASNFKQTLVESINIDKQVDTSSQEDKLSELDEVVVLGSRGLPRVKTEAPVPVDFINMKSVVGDIAQVSINSILNYVSPSFNSTPTTVADGTDHLDPAALRGLGPDQTLVLVNGKRRHTSALVNVNGSVGRGSVGTDLSAIPSIAIDGIEILRDGAAAQYGSDAIAGVLNLNLKKGVGKTKVLLTTGTNITTFESYTENTKGDFSNKINPEYKKYDVIDGQLAQFAINRGFSLGKKGSFINLSLSLDLRQPTNRAGEGTGSIITSEGNTGKKPKPENLVKDNEYMARNRFSRSDIKNVVGQSQVRGAQVFINGIVPLNENKKSEIYYFGGGNYKLGKSAANYRHPGDKSNDTNLYSKGYIPFIHSAITDMSFATGYRTEIKNGWLFDVSNVFGYNSIDFNVSNTLNPTATNPRNMVDKGNLKINPEQKSFYVGMLKFIQNTSNIDLSKSFDVLSGLNFASGFEYRFENYAQKQGEEASWANYNRRNKNNLSLVDYNGDSTLGLVPYGTNGIVRTSAAAQGFSGMSPESVLNKIRYSTAFYVDLEQNVTKELLIDLAGRLEYYSDFGSNFSWKASSRFKLNKWVNIRGSASTGFRAPSLHQRYFTRVSILTAGGMAFNVGTFPNDSKIAKTLGIEALKPEISKSYSAGFTASVKGIILTFDAYLTSIRDRIVYTSKFDTTDKIKSILEANNANSASFFVNALNTETVGMDAVISFPFRINEKQKLKIDLSGNYTKTIQYGDLKYSELLKDQLPSYFSPSNYSYYFNSIPRAKVNLLVNYNFDKIGVFFKQSYIGKTEHVEEFGSSNWIFKQSISPVFITDVTLSLNISKEVKISIGANNLFDKYTDLISGEKGKLHYFEKKADKSGYNTYIGEPKTVDEVVDFDGKGKLTSSFDNNDKLTGGFVGNQFNYSRRVSMIGLNGRFVFARLELNF